MVKHPDFLNHHHHQSLNCEGRWGTTDEFATSFLHFSLFSTALWDLVTSRPVHSLMLSSHLFLCLHGDFLKRSNKKPVTYLVGVLIPVNHKGLYHGSKQTSIYLPVLFCSQVIKPPDSFFTTTIFCQHISQKDQNNTQPIL